VLSLLAGGVVPTVLGTGSCRMLTADVAGVDQYEAPPSAQLEMVRLLVDLQAEWTSRVDDLLDLGLPDLRSPALIRQISEVVARRSDELTAEERGVLARLVDGLPGRFAQITECGLPDTLVHGDFHLGNIRGDHGRAPGRFTILDWGDSGVGNPLLDQLAFERFLRPDDRAAVAAEWSRLWRARSAGSDPDRAAALLRPVTALREAAVYQRFLDRIEPDERRYHDGDPVAELRKAVLLSDDDPAGPARSLHPQAP
jgi:aminoglycoside phosphotransferase (APT) family kinase protein